MHSGEKTKIEFEIRRMGDCGEEGGSRLLMASQSAGVFSLAPPTYHSSRVHMHDQIYKLSTLLNHRTLGFVENYINNYL